MQNEQILDEQKDYGGGILITSTAKSHLSKAVATATVLAIIMGINVLVSFISNVSQLYMHWMGGMGSTMPTFYRLMPFFQLIMLGFQIAVLIVLMKFIGKGRDFTTVNPSFSGEQTFALLNSLFLWMAVNAALVMFNILLYLIAPLVINMG